MNVVTLPRLHSGWTYAQSGRPIAYVMPPGRPEEARYTAFATWWEALRYAVLYAHSYPACDYIGGPGQ